MGCRITDLSNKAVICMNSGVCLGYVNDVEVDTRTGQLCAIVVYGKCKCLGLLGRDDDTVISWDCIEVMGEDTILVNFEPVRHKRRGPSKGFINKIIGN